MAVISVQATVAAARDALQDRDHEGVYAAIAGVAAMGKAAATFVQSSMTNADRQWLFDHLLALRTPRMDNAARAVSKLLLAELLLRGIDGDRALLVSLIGSADIDRLDAEEHHAIALVRAILDDDLAGAQQLAAHRATGALAVTHLLMARVLAASGLPAKALTVLRAGRDTRLRRELHGFETYQENTSLHLQDNSVSRSVNHVAICAVLKNEEDDIEEWIDFHQRIGVERFFLYENQSTDSTYRKLRLLSKKVPIRLYRVPDQPAQTIAYRHFLAFHRLDATWVAFIDGDEFLDPAQHDNLGSAIDAFGDAAAIACNWKMFGSNGHRERPAVGCLRGFTRRAALLHPHLKMIVRPARVIRYLNPHHFIVDGSTCNGLRQPIIPLQGMARPVEDGLIGINHYIVKSHAQWLNKQSRGRPMKDSNPVKFREDEFFEAYDRNDVLDTSILRFVTPSRDV